MSVRTPLKVDGEAAYLHHNSDFSGWAEVTLADGTHLTIPGSVIRALIEHGQAEARDAVGELAQRLGLEAR
jgi:hypothetical protein